MGGGSKPAPPPPPPEEKYRNQIGLFTSHKQNQYQQQADDYHKQLGNYQQQFSDFSQQGNDTYNTVSNMGLGDVSGDDWFSNQRSQINRAMNDYSGLTNDYQNLARPEFQTSFNGFTMPGTDSGAYTPGQHHTYNKGKLFGERTVYTGNDNWANTYIPAMASVSAPTLEKGLSDYQLGQYDDGYENALDHLNSLESRYNTEKNRINNYQDSLRSSLEGYADQLGNYGIQDIDQVNNLSRSLDRRRQRFSEFDTPLSTDFSYSSGLFDQLDTDINNLRDQYNTEQNRISDFQNSLNQSGADWSTAVSGLDITDADQIAQLNRDIGQRLSDAGNFTSELDTNFDLTALNQAMRSATDLQSARDAELARIANAEASAMDTANWLSTSAGANQGYSLSQINAMQDRLDRQRADLTRFDSLLDFNYSDELAGLDSAQASLDELSGRRSNQINNLYADQGNLLAQINSTDLSNESGLRDLQAQIRQLQAQGNAFTGGRAGDLNSQISDLYNQSSDKLQQLYNRRSDLEAQAQDLLSANRDTEFLDLDQLAAVEDQFNTLNSQVSQYSASAAGDEISQLQALLGQNRSRLEQDAANVAAAQNSAASEITSQLDGSGNIISGNLPFNEFLTEEEYLALMRQQQEDEDTNPFLNPTFAASVGIRV